MSKIPDLGFWKLWNISFGFFGVQIAYALQSANISRIFSTLGADPHDLSYFWILPPLAGIIVQPIIGALSDRTWTRFGRRIPYLFVGALFAVAVMCLLPNAGSFGKVDTDRYFPKCSENHTSIAQALEEIGVDSSKSYRKEIYNANFTDSYRYTAKQNTSMLILLKQGILLKP